MLFQKKPMLKGCIELYKIKCVEIVCCDVPIPCIYKYPFQVSLSDRQGIQQKIVNYYMPFILFQMSLQVFYDNYYLYIFAPDNEWRQKWVTALKEGKQFRTLYFRPTDYWAPLI